jgi:hypothetical protein
MMPPQQQKRSAGCADKALAVFAMRVDVVNIFPRCFIGLIRPAFRFRTPDLSGLLV